MVDNANKAKTSGEMPTGTPLEGELTDRPREEITVAQAKERYRKTPWSNEDLARKSGMGSTSVARFWNGELPHNGMAWRGIVGVLERALRHVRVVPPKK